MILRLLWGRTRWRHRFSLHVKTRVLLVLIVLFSGCDDVDPPPATIVPATASLSQTEVESILAHAVEQSQRVNQKVVIAISDREGNILGVFRMTGSGLDSTPVPVNGMTVMVTNIDISIRKARTAAFLSSNQNAFSTTTACFITRPHFPPGISNTAAGPLFGVGFSSLPFGDIMPNGSALNDKPGGIPIYKM